MKFKKFLTAPILTAVTLMFLSQGCGLWRDFTTFFNLYYNARELFNNAEEQIKAEKKDVFAVVEPNIPQSAFQQMPKIIEKLSNLLQFHDKSAYIDEAIMMIGKAFYYQRNYLKAYRKFQELIATQPESPYIIDATFWMAKTQMQTKKFTEGLELLDKTRELAIQEDNNEILTEILIEEVKYYKFLEKNDEAIAKLNEIIETTDDSDYRSKANYEVGELYLKVKKYDLAEIAYREVLDGTPSFEVEFQTTLKLGKVKAYQQKYEEALEVFDDMKGENKFIDNFDEIGVERGIVLKKLQKFDDAYKQFVEVDTSKNNNVFQGIARYEMGDLFENYIMQYDSALTYYKKAENSASNAEYYPKIRSKATLFKKYDKLRQERFSFNKQLFYLDNPEEFVKDSVEYYRDELDLFADPLAKTNLDSLARKDSLRKLDSLIAIGVINKDSLIAANKRKTDSLRAAQGLPPDPDRGGDRFGNEKDDEELISQSQGTPGGQGTPGNTPQDPNKPQKAPPPVRPVLSRDSINVILVKTYLDLGNIFLGEFKKPDSAYYYYSRVLNEFDSTSFNASALYAMATYYSTINENDKADSLYNLIYDNYPNDKIINVVAEKLEKAKVVTENDPAEELFLSAEKKYISGTYGDAVTGMYAIHQAHPASQFASKGLYTAGFILENNLRMGDSAVVVYDTLIAKYPKTTYANKVQGKVIFYKQELKRLEQVRLDSIKKFQDSIAAVRAQDSLKKIEALNPVKPDSLNGGTAIPDSLKPAQQPRAVPENNGTSDRTDHPDGLTQALIKTYNYTAYAFRSRSYLPSSAGRRVNAQFVRFRPPFYIS